MKRVFLPEAEHDIQRLYEFLLDKNPLAAQKAMLAIDEGVQMLIDNPFLGIEMADSPRFRQLFIPFGRSAYVLRYHLDLPSDTLVVVRVWHGRENRA